MIQITSGRVKTAIKTVIYGPEGIGKSTFASQFPDPVFLDTEGSTVHMDVKRLPRPALWVELLNEVEYVRQNPGCCKTLVLDTADWAETLCSEYVCARDQKTGIEDYGYGKGYKYVFEEFGRLLNALEQVRETGTNIVICCHAAIRKFEQPDELGAYDRWGLKLTDAPKASIAGMVKEWADMVIFANYKTIVVNVDGKGATKGKNKVQGGKRMMYTTHHSCWDAKNRFGLPEEAEFGYEVVRGVIEGDSLSQPKADSSLGDGAMKDDGGAGAAATGTARQESPSALARAVERAAQPTQAAERAATSSVSGEAAATFPRGEGKENPSALARAVERAAATPVQPVPTQTSPEAAKGPQEGAQEGAGDLSANAPEAGQAANAASDAQFTGLPDALVRMMKDADVTPNDVRYVIAKKGYYPANTPWPVICGNEQFMQGWLMHPQVWPKVVEMAKALRDEEPF